MTFEIIDKHTGKIVSDKRVNEIATEGGIDANSIDQFYTGENGTILLVDKDKHIVDCTDKLIVKRKGKYPDIEYLEKAVWSAILQQHSELLQVNKFTSIDAEMFQQTWGNTAGGFSEPGMIAGQAMTTQYTTVLHILVNVMGKINHDVSMEENLGGSQRLEFYGVCFGNRPAYLIEDPNDKFMSDLDNKKMLSVYDAKTSY